MTLSSLRPDEALDEPLAESARLARDLARTHCGDHPDGYTCRAYHGFWQYLRLMGLGKTLSGLSGRYVAEIAAFFEDRKRHRGEGARSVLISGCADYSALAHVLHACRIASVDAKIDALDHCPTPLGLNDWYARRRSARVRTIAADILDHQDHYDLIVTSGFLGYFHPRTRPRLFETFAALLRPGGALMFANRLRSEPEDVRVGFSAEQIARFADRAAELTSTLPPEAALCADEAREAAEAYAREFSIYPVNSATNVRALAEAAGLEWIAGDATTPSRAHPAAVAGPTMKDGAAYLFVTLCKT